MNICLCKSKQCLGGSHNTIPKLQNIGSKTKNCVYLKKLSKIFKKKKERDVSMGMGFKVEVAPT